MKAFVLGALLVSFSAVACPNLAGVYKTCTSSAGEVAPGSTITQSTKNGVTTYVLSYFDEETEVQVEEKIIADGVARSAEVVDDETGMTIAMSTVASCSGKALVMNASIATQGQELANVLVNVTKSGNKLVSVTKGSSMGQAIDETEVCE